jgi:hypothetical protein
MSVGIWRETDRVLFKDGKLIVGCPRKDEGSAAAPFCTGFAAVEIGKESKCPKCGTPLGAKKDGQTGRWMGMVPVM